MILIYSLSYSLVLLTSPAWTFAPGIRPCLLSITLILLHSSYSTNLQFKT